MFLATLSVAGIAGYFSVYGLAKVFSGSFISVILMGAALEAGKLMAASFLYRFWNGTSWFLKLPLILLIAALMVLTSIGVSGYLTSSYQIDTLSFKESEEKVKLYEEELNRLITRKTEIDTQISSLPPDYVTAKQRLMSSFKEEYDRLKPRIEFLTTEIQRLKTENIQVQSKIGPIIFISENLGLNPDKAVVWLTIFIVLIFDPLALCLTIATNVVVVTRVKEKKIKSVDISSPRPDLVTNPPIIKEIHPDTNQDGKIEPKVSNIKQKIEPKTVANTIFTSAIPIIRQIKQDINKI
jgi:hypothetical protein